MAITNHTNDLTNFDFPQLVWPLRFTNEKKPTNDTSANLEKNILSLVRISLNIDRWIKTRKSQHFQSFDFFSF